jgi:putative integral membrane protein (TIGR02587 family)
MGRNDSPAERYVRDQDPGGWRQELHDLMAAIAGGSIVGMPLLYTMEMWWHGMTLGAGHLLAIVGVILVTNFGFSLISGFRHDDTPGEAAIESLTSVGIGLVFSTLILWLIGELSFRTSMMDSIGKILLEAVAVSVGVSFANAQVRSKSRSGDDDDDRRQHGGGKRQPADPERAQLRADLRDASASLAGATVLALSIAPTEEVLLISSRLGPWQLLLLLGFCLAICYVILFASGFEEHEVHVQSVFQNPYVETVLTCAIALLVSAGLLWLLGEQQTLSTPSRAVASVITLGLPATVGAAAGRLIV